MSLTFQLKIFSPERELYNGKVMEVLTEGASGKVGILANHIPMVMSVVPNITEFTDENGKRHKAFTSSGILKVQGNQVEMLCEACEWPEEIDKKRAEEAEKRAEQRLSHKDGIDVQRAELALMRSMTRLKALR